MRREYDVDYAHYFHIVHISNHIVNDAMELFHVKHNEARILHT
jgi:hypothetical protein